MFDDLIETRQDAAGVYFAWLPDGVYLGLPEPLYFAQEALGSSDLIRLHLHKHGWWWQSRYNPDRVDKVSKERTYGSAAHALILEGPAAFERRFIVSPDKPDNALVSGEDIKAKLIERGFSVRGTSSWRKEDWLAAAELNLPDVPCWPNMLAEFERECAEAQRAAISAVDARMLRIMYDAAMAHEALAAILKDGGPFPPLAEVSILKTLPGGVRRRWRLDRLFPQFNFDLKTLGNWSGRPLPHSVGDHIGRNGYDIQRYDYDDGRRALNDFVDDGFQVYGGDIESRDWLKRLVDLSRGGASLPERWSDRPPGVPSWDWVWLFYQKPEPTGRAPVVFPVYDDGFSPLWEYGRAKAHKALRFYLERVAEFGLTRPWTHVEEVHYTDPDRRPNVSLPHWVGEDEPTDADAYAEEGDRT